MLKHLHHNITHLNNITSTQHLINFTQTTINQYKGNKIPHQHQLNKIIHIYNNSLSSPQTTKKYIHKKLNLLISNTSLYTTHKTIK